MGTVTGSSQPFKILLTAEDTTDERRLILGVTLEFILCMI